MEIACRSAGIVSAEEPGHGLMEIAEAGFSEVMIDFSAYAEAEALEAFGTEKNMAELSRLPEDVSALWETARPFWEEAKKASLSIGSACAPYLQQDTKRGDLNVLLENLTQESLRICRRVGCRMLVVRPLFAGVARAEAWEVNRSFFLRLAETAKEQDVQILLENQGRNVSGHLIRGICADEDEASRWVDELNAACGDDRFGFCFDVGIAGLLGQDLDAFVRGMGKRIKIVVLSDNDGYGESALLPFTAAVKGDSKTDWPRCIAGLRSIGYRRKLVLQLESTAKSFPFGLRTDVLRMARRVGEYFVEQVGADMEAQLRRYEARVLFGAGNLCRLYGKVFGTAYPPLFVCDNNKALWRQKIEGVEIRSPQALLALPEDCAIVICNVFHCRSIEDQLRGMGLKNPIVVFNNEYLFAKREETKDFGTGGKGC